MFAKNRMKQMLMHKHIFKKKINIIKIGLQIFRIIISLNMLMKIPIWSNQVKTISLKETQAYNHNRNPSYNNTCSDKKNASTNLLDNTLEVDFNFTSLEHPKHNDSNLSSKQSNSKQTSSKLKPSFMSQSIQDFRNFSNNPEKQYKLIYISERYIVFTQQSLNQEKVTNKLQSSKKNVGTASTYIYDQQMYMTYKIAKKYVMCCEYCSDADHKMRKSQIKERIETESQTMNSPVPKFTQTSYTKRKDSAQFNNNQNPQFNENIVDKNNIKYLKQQLFAESCFQRYQHSYSHSNPSTNKRSNSKVTKEKFSAKLFLLYCGRNNRYDIDIFADGNFLSADQYYERKSTGLVIDAKRKPLRPLVKTDSVCCLDKSNDAIYLFGTKNVHRFQIASLLWKYSISRNKWQQLDDSIISKITNCSQLKQQIPFTLCDNYLYLIQQNKIVMYNIPENKIQQIHHLRYDPEKIKIAKCISASSTINKITMLFLNDSYLVTLEGVNKNRTVKYLDKGVFLQSKNHEYPKQFFSLLLASNKGNTQNQLTIKLFSTIDSHMPNIDDSNCFTQKSINGSSLLCLKFYSIDFSCLTTFPQNTSAIQNIPLIYYFNKKAYSDVSFYVEKRQIYCSKQILQFYSPKFKKYHISQPTGKKSSSNQSTITQMGDMKKQEEKCPQQMVVKIQAKYPTIYFLLQQLYTGVKGNPKTFDEDTFIELLFMAQKLQIKDVQISCQRDIILSINNFEKMIDYYKNYSNPVYKMKLKDSLAHFVGQNYNEITQNTKISANKMSELMQIVLGTGCDHLETIDLICDLGCKQTQNGQNPSKLKRMKHIQVCRKCLVVLKGMQRKKPLAKIKSNDYDKNNTHMK